MLRRKILHINKFTAYSCIYIIFSVKETNLLYIWSFIGYSVNIYYILDGYNNLSVVEIQQNRALYKGDMIITFTDITTPWTAMKKWCLGKRRLSVFICVILKSPSYTQQTHLRNKIYFSRSSRSLQISRFAIPEILPRVFSPRHYYLATPPSLLCLLMARAAEAPKRFPFILDWVCTPASWRLKWSRLLLPNTLQNKTFLICWSLRSGSIFKCCAYWGTPKITTASSASLGTGVFHELWSSSSL